MVKPMSKDEPARQVKTQPPSEEQIVALLSQIKPRPGRHFYQKMEYAPWESRRSWFTHRLLRPLAITALIITIVLGATFTIPAVQATARQLLNYFLPSSSDQRTVQAPFPLPGSKLDIYYGLNLEQAQKQSGYPLKTLTVLPDKMAFAGAHVQPSLKAVALRYTNGIDNLIFTQRMLGNVEEFSSIGASAVVEPIQVRGVQGEFVRGGWKMQTSQSPTQAASNPGTQANLGLYWDADLPQNILRWQENGMSFEIISIGEAVKKVELVEIANSIR
jgi:hypothetical protein